MCLRELDVHCVPVVTAAWVGSMMDLFNRPQFRLQSLYLVALEEIASTR